MVIRLIYIIKKEGNKYGQRTIILDSKTRYGEYDVLGEPDEIIYFMDMAMNSVNHQTRFKSFTEYLLYLRLTDNDIMFVYNEINKLQ